MEVFMDDFSVYGDSFTSCLSHLESMLKRFEDQLGSKLGEVPFHGQRRHSPWPQNFKIWD